MTEQEFDKIVADQEEYDFEVFLQSVTVGIPEKFKGTEYMLYHYNWDMEAHCGNYYYVFPMNNRLIKREKHIRE